MTNETPLVSIITPCYNDAQFIAECIESVLNQDYPHIEHIIQDAASNDSTVEMLRRYSNTPPSKINYVSEPDNGQSDGLNRAIQRASGDILLVLNADDALRPHAASWAVEQLAQDPDVAVVYGDVYIIDEDSEIIEEYTAHDYDFEKLLCVELVPPAQAAFIRGAHLAQVGWYADDTLDTCPDYEMWVRIGLKFPMKHVPGVVTKYRRHTRQFDSKSERTVQRFIASKKLVMDRVFDAPGTPSRIKNMRGRAYGGLSMWALVAEVGMREKRLPSFRTVMFFLRNARYAPLAALLKNLRAYIVLFLKRCIRKVLKVVLTAMPKTLLLQLLGSGGVADARHTLLMVTKKDVAARTIREKWQKLLCECLIAGAEQHSVAKRT